MKIPKNHKIELIAGDTRLPSTSDPYYRNGKLYATSGFAAVSIPVTDYEHDTEGSISCEAIRAARKLDKNNVMVSARHSLALSSDATYPRQDKEDFPDIEKVTPDRKDYNYSMALNAKILKSLADAMGSQNSVIVLQINTNDAKAPVIVTNIDPKSENQGLLMPVRRAR